MVADGLASTARVITAAALIMMAVFGAFGAHPDPVVKMVGLGLAVAVLVDATLVRMVLVPGTMVLLGRANWWLPSRLDRILPTIDIDGDTTPAVARVAVRAVAVDAPPRTSTVTRTASRQRAVASRSVPVVWQGLGGMSRPRPGRGRRGPATRLR